MLDITNQIRQTLRVIDLASAQRTSSSQSMGAGQYIRSGVYMQVGAAKLCFGPDCAYVLAWRSGRVADKAQWGGHLSALNKLWHPLQCTSTQSQLAGWQGGMCLRDSTLLSLCKHHLQPPCLSFARLENRVRNPTRPMFACRKLASLCC